MEKNKKKSLPDFPNCNNCYACVHVCPMNIIELDENIGACGPKINYEECIHCNKCIEVCPKINDTEYNIPLHAYAATSNLEVRKKMCSSGGIAEEIANAFIKTGGVVFGAELQRDFSVKHIAITQCDELYRIRGSKYARSNIKSSYAEIETYLRANKKVLFIGTPCQVDAVKRVFGKKNSNIFLIDLVCHGVVPQPFFKQYINDIKNKIPGEIRGIEFRGQAGYCLALYDESRKLLYRGDIFNDILFNGFYYGWLMSQNCFRCKYSISNRVGDITLGDFWGLGKNKLKDTQDGVSLCLINSHKGSQLLEPCKKECDFEERTLAEAIRGNPALRYCEKQIFLSNYFWYWNRKKGFKTALEKCIPFMKILIFYKKCKNELKKSLKSILNFKK